jgi:serine/threonine protein kinase
MSDWNAHTVLIGMKVRDTAMWETALMRSTFKFISSKDLISRYQYPMRKLGIGGYGVVYLATRQNDNVQVAVKIFTKYEVDGREEEPSIDMAREEARMLIYLRLVNENANCPPHLICYQGHYAISPSIDEQARTFFEELALPTDLDAYFFIETVYSRSTAMFDLIESGVSSTFAVFKTTAIFLDLARALAYMHDHGSYHRDVKPENILVLNAELNRPSASLIDVGLACVRAQNKLEKGCKGYAAGIVYYFAPGEYDR